MLDHHWANVGPMSHLSNPYWANVGPMSCLSSSCWATIGPIWVPYHVYQIHVGQPLGWCGYHVRSINPCWATIGPMWVPYQVYQSMLSNHWADVGSMSGLSIHVGQPLGRCGYHVRSSNPCWATIGPMWVPCQVYQSLLGNHWANVGTMSGLAIHVEQPLGQYWLICGYCFACVSILKGQNHQLNANELKPFRNDSDLFIKSH